MKCPFPRQYGHGHFTYHHTTQYGQLTLMTGQQSMYQWWNYLRRQLFVMDTYATPHNRLINHGMLAALSYLSLAVTAAMAFSAATLLEAETGAARSTSAARSIGAAWSLHAAWSDAVGPGSAARHVIGCHVTQE